MPICEGKSSKLRENNFCSSCGKESGDDTKLFRCSRCEIVFYCNAECQKEAHSKHKAICGEVYRAKKRVEKEAEPLKSHSDWGCPPFQNLFEENVGDFWGIIESRDYIRARMAYAKVQEKLAKEVQTVHAWNLVLENELESLRLCSSDNMGIRSKACFTLLRVNRDDDAYCFCRYWGGSAAIDADHSGTKEGEWLYSGAEDTANCCYGNILEECDDLSLAMILAVAIIKMRLVALYNERLKEVDTFISAREGASLGSDIVTEIRRSVMGSPKDETKLRDQGRLLDGLLDAIDAKNPTLLPALLHPFPLMSQASPPYYSEGSPAEAFFIIPDAIQLWNDIPGAVELLATRIGTTTPEYPHVCAS